MGKSCLFLSAASLFAMGVLGAAPLKAAELEVVASFSILEDIAKNVGGKRVNISSLVGRDADAHAYEPKPQDAALLTKAQVVLVNGLGYEGFLERLVKTSGTKATVIEVAKGITPLENAKQDEHAGHDHDEKHEHKHEEKHAHEHADDSKKYDHDHEKDHKHEHHDGHDHGAYDPHAWQSVGNVIVYVANIKDAFCAADKAGCDTYTANAENYTERLRELEKGIRLGLSSLPENRRTVITSHAAFNYFGNAYGLTFLAPEGVSTHSEASAKDVASLIDQIKKDKVSAVFVENISNGRLMEQIAAETGVKVGGKLYSDALTATDGPAPDYLTMMRNNLSTITLALQED